MPVTMYSRKKYAFSLTLASRVTRRLCQCDKTFWARYV